MTIKRPFLYLALTFLLMATQFTAPRVHSADVVSLSTPEPIQIAQSETDAPDEDEEDLDEDDC